MVRPSLIIDMSMKNYILTAMAMATAFGLTAKTYELMAPQQWQPVHAEHLEMGGTAPDGGSIEVNNFYVSRNGVPPISRCSA